jgi:hypothetical protein
MCFFSVGAPKDHWSTGYLSCSNLLDFQDHLYLDRLYKHACEQQDKMKRILISKLLNCIYLNMYIHMYILAATGVYMMLKLIPKFIFCKIEIMH